jgi:hypothetical protein
MLLRRHQESINSKKLHESKLKKSVGVFDCCLTKPTTITARETASEAAARAAEEAAKKHALEEITRVKAQDAGNDCLHVIVSSRRSIAHRSARGCCCRGAARSRAGCQETRIAGDHAQSRTRCWYVYMSGFDVRDLLTAHAAREAAADEALHAAEAAAKKHQLEEIMRSKMQDVGVLRDARSVIH